VKKVVGSFSLTLLAVLFLEAVILADNGFGKLPNPVDTAEEWRVTLVVALAELVSLFGIFYGFRATLERIFSPPWKRGGQTTLVLFFLFPLGGCVPYASVGGGLLPIVIPGNPGGEFITVRNDTPEEARCSVIGLVHRHDILHRGESIAPGGAMTYFFVGSYYGEYRYSSRRRDVTISCDLFSGTRKVGWWQERFSVYARQGDYRNQEATISPPRERWGR